MEINSTTLLARTDSNRATNAGSGQYLQELRNKFSTVNFSVGGGFGGTGTNNISIDPGLLQKLEEDPSARAEFEEKISSMANFMSSNVARHAAAGRRQDAQGSVMHEDGTISTWGRVSTAPGAGSNNALGGSKNDDDDGKTKVSRRMTIKELLEELDEKRREESVSQINNLNSETTAVKASDKEVDTLA